MKTMWTTTINSRSSRDVTTAAIGAAITILFSFVTIETEAASAGGPALGYSRETLRAEQRAFSIHIGHAEGEMKAAQERLTSGLPVLAERNLLRALVIVDAANLRMQGYEVRVAALRSSPLAYNREKQIAILGATCVDLRAHARRLEDSIYELSTRQPAIVTNTWKALSTYLDQRVQFTNRFKNQSLNAADLVDDIQLLQDYPLPLVIIGLINGNNYRGWIKLSNGAWRSPAGIDFLADGSLMPTNIVEVAQAHKPTNDVAAATLNELKQKTCELDQSVNQLRREQSNLVNGLLSRPSVALKTETAPTNALVGLHRPENTTSQTDAPLSVATRASRPHSQSPSIEAALPPSSTKRDTREVPSNPGLMKPNRTLEIAAAGPTKQAAEKTMPLLESKSLMVPFSNPSSAGERTINWMDVHTQSVSAIGGAPQTVVQAPRPVGKGTASRLPVTQTENAREPLHLNAEGQSSRARDFRPAEPTPPAAIARPGPPAGCLRNVIPMLALAGTSVAALGGLGLIALARWSQRRFDVVLARIAPDGTTAPTLMTLQPKVERIVLGDGAPRVEPADLPQAVPAAIVLDRFARAAITADSARVILGEQVVENCTARLEIGDEVRVHSGAENARSETFVLRQVTTAGDGAELENPA